MEPLTAGYRNRLGTLVGGSRSTRGATCCADPRHKQNKFLFRVSWVARVRAANMVQSDIRS